MTLNCVVVDDSTIQRLSIVKLIEKHQSLNLMAEYSGALECSEGLKKHQVDLIFLDIEMPKLSGFELLDVLNNKPQIIFITGKTEYAFKAFNYDAIDYLHKPITKERFNTAVEKALKQYKLKSGVYDEEGEHIYVRSDGEIHQIFIKDIKWIEARGDYMKIVTEEDNFLTLNTMKSYEEELPQDKFLRVHKSYLVKLNKIDRFSSTKLEIDEYKIPISRNKKKLLVDILKQKGNKK